jgi:hypothetical protein
VYSGGLFREVLVFKLTVPLEIDNSVLMAFANAEIAALRIKDVPH